MTLKDSQLPAQLSYQNHFKFGYNGESFNLRQSPFDQWWVSYGQCEHEPMNFGNECIRTAQRIRSSTDLPLWVLFSGGVDSEVALQSFVHAKIPVHAAILRFKENLNLHDISYAVIACEKLEVPYKIFDLDLVQFWEDRLWDYATPSRCVSPQLLTTMYLADQVEGYPILGSGECLLVKELSLEWCLWEKEKIASWYRHFLVQGRSACPGFFQFSAELILSYLKDPFVQKLTNNQLTGEIDTQNSKLAIYQQHFNLVNRPKYTGFEKVQDLDYKFRQKLMAAFPDSNQIIKTPIHDLLKALSPRQNHARL